MIAHFFRKPLQGYLFKKSSNIFLGYKHISTLHEDNEDLSSQECVGKDVSEGNFKRSDDGPSVVGGTQIGNVKRSDDGPSVVGSAQRGMSYAEAVSKR